MPDLSKYTDEELITLKGANLDKELESRGYEYGWHKKIEYAGEIYILVNPAFPDLVKIGYADNVEKRMKSFNRNSGLPDPYHCYAILKVKKRLEDLQLHKLIDTLDPTLRHAKNREFYEMSQVKAYGILSAIAQINGDEDCLTLNPLQDKYFEQGSVSNTTNIKSGTNSEEPPKMRLKKTRLTFKMINIPIGATLVYTKDPNITVTTVDDNNKVNYQGTVYPISRLVSILMGGSQWQGGQYFTYQGKRLVDIREEMGL